jgi:hypothetical protein
VTPAQHRAGEAFLHRGYFGNPGLGASTSITSAIGSGLVTAGGVIAMVPAIGPIIGGITAAVGALTSLIGGLFQPDVTKEEATAIVNQVELQVLNPLLSQWQALTPEQKTVSVQQAFLQAVDKALASVRQGCSNPALGTAGQNCISERLIQGGPAPWCPTSTGCDWITAYRVPIANDPQVHPDPVATVGGTVGGTVGDVGGTVGDVGGTLGALGGISPLWLGVGIIAAALLLVGD